MLNATQWRSSAPNQKWALSGHARILYALGAASVGIWSVLSEQNTAGSRPCARLGTLPGAKVRSAGMIGDGGHVDTFFFFSFHKIFYEKIFS